MQELITVIVPVYNVLPYLENCVKSILCQTYNNLEIILVDDGSTDGSEKLCDFFKEKDQRIKVIHKANGGLSDARNAGLLQANGDYFAFVDSDDSIEPDMLELLANNLIKYDSDVSCCRYTRVWEDGKKQPIGETGEINVYNGIEGFKEYLYGKTMDPFVCNKLYKRQIITKEDGSLQLFIKDIVGEDNPFNADVFQRAKRIVLAGEAKYNYLQKRTGAITNSGVSQKKIDSVYWWDKIRKYCKESYPELEKYALRRQMLFYVGLYNMIYADNKYKDDKKYISTFVKKHAKEIIKSDICESTVKMAVFLLAHFPYIYNVAMRLYKSVKGEVNL